MKKEILPVIFRKFKDGDLIAFFPTEVDSFSQFECMSYMFIGQHSTARVELITELKKCTVEEYTPLFNHLNKIYAHNENPVELQIVDRSHRKYYAIRLKKTKELLGMK
jgi:hypothetical protein